MHNFWLSFTGKLGGSRQLLKIVFYIPLLKFRPNFVVQDCPKITKNDLILNSTPENRSQHSTIVITINIKEAQHPLKREKQVIDKSSIMLKISTKSMHRVLV